MRYLMLILADEKAWANLPKKELEAVYAQYGAYDGEIKGAVKVVAGDELEPTAKACRIRVQNGKPRVTDGPFTETKEVVGGYYLFDADSREEAIRIAGRCPGAAGGTIELYPVKPMS
jgi:hypothetical protein